MLDIFTALVGMGKQYIHLLDNFGKYFSETAGNIYLNSR